MIALRGGFVSTKLAMSSADEGSFGARSACVADDEAMALLQVLAARGIIECEAGATQGRIRGG